MDTAYLLPSAALATIGTMYAIFVAVAIFSAKYFDQDLKQMRLLLKYFLLLSVVVILTELYNGYILYLQSGGTWASDFHILTKIFPSTNFLDWSWTLFILSIIYILLFSSALLIFVLFKVCSLKVEELNAKKDKHIEKIRDLRVLHEKRNEEFSEVENEANALTKKNQELTSEYPVKIQKSYDKIQKACKSEENVKSKFTALDFEKLLKPKKELFDESENPFEESIKKLKEVENIEDLPNDLLKAIKEHRECLENLSEEFKDISKSLKEIGKKVDDLCKCNEEIEKELTKLEVDKKNMEHELECQLNEIEHILDIYGAEKIKRFFKKFRFKK